MSECADLGLHSVVFVGCLSRIGFGCRSRIWVRARSSRWAITGVFPHTLFPAVDTSSRTDESDLGRLAIAKPAKP